jgi:hypothetical protein
MNILLLPSGTSAVSYTSKISKNETTHYKCQPSSSTPINKNSDWPKPLTCDNTINPPSAILSLRNLWGWVGGGREEARVWCCANKCYKQTINQWTLAWHKRHCSIWVVENPYTGKALHLWEEMWYQWRWLHKSCSSNALPSTTSFLLCNLEKQKLQQTYGHEAGPTVVTDKQGLLHHSQ